MTPSLRLRLHNDHGPEARITALIDTSYHGELYLSAQQLSKLRRHPEDYKDSWQELNPEPVPGLNGLVQCSSWRGTISLEDGASEDSVKAVQVKVHQGRRHQQSQARVGQAFLQRFGVVLVFDRERGEAQVLFRGEAG